MKRWAAIVLLSWPLAVWGGGPILVDTTSSGGAVVWEDGIVSYNPETGGGTLGNLSNEEARDLLEELFDDWSEVTLTDGQSAISTVSLTVTEGSGLGSVDATNIDDHFTYCPPTESCPTTDDPFVIGSARSGQSPIIFDDDGTLTDLIQGSGASQQILGFAGPRVVQRVGSELFVTEAQAILNGLFVDCADGADASDSCQSPEVSEESFKAVIFHELGHFLGLDHTQVNSASMTDAINGDATAQTHIATMLPLFLGSYQISPHFDDKVAVSTLYPSSAFLTSFCTITGTVFLSDGVTELQGVNVIARNTNSTRVEATSFVSGALFVGASDCTAEAGDFQLRGIRSGSEYTLEIEAISSSFTGGSSVEPCDPPASGFNEVQLSGIFSCSSGGQTITSGSSADTDFVTTKSSSSGDDDDDDDGGDSSGSIGGCSLIR